MKKILTSISVMLLSLSTLSADGRFVLHYDEPAIDKKLINQGKGKKPTKFGYMQTALPIGNGRLGAMFTGGIDTEHLVTNDITLWMNAKRGQEPLAQTGSHQVTLEELEEVREVYRDEVFGEKKGSMESTSTEVCSVAARNWEIMRRSLMSGSRPATIPLQPQTIVVRSIPELA